MPRWPEQDPRSFGSFVIKILFKQIGVWFDTDFVYLVNTTVRINALNFEG